MAVPDPPAPGRRAGPGGYPARHWGRPRRRASRAGRGVRLIPYFEIPRLVTILDLRLNVLWAAVVAGLALAWWRAVRIGVRRDHEAELLHEQVFWSMAGGFAGGHLVGVLLYPLPGATPSLSDVLAISGDFSAVGALAGALALGSCVAVLRRQPLLPLLDLGAEAGLAGWCLCRVGCALAHDHPSIPVSAGCPLALAPWPDGTARLDLGLVELLLLLPLLGCLHLHRDGEPRPIGATFALVLGYVACVRFVLDFLRAQPGFAAGTGGDARHAGLTVAQWAAVAVVGGAVVLLRCGPARGAREALQDR